MANDREGQEIHRLRHLIDEINLSDEEDRLIWTPGSGIFSTKECCRLLSTNQAVELRSTSNWNTIWKSKLPPKINIFLWKIQRGILHTRRFLNSRISNIPPLCVWCEKADESIDHIFWDCILAKEAWEFTGNWWSNKNKLSRMRTFSPEKLLKGTSNGIHAKYWQMSVAATIWSIWLSRNEFLFERKRIKKKTTRGTNIC